MVTTTSSHASVEMIEEYCLSQKWNI